MSKFYGFNASNPKYSFEQKEYVRLNYKTQKYSDIAKVLGPGYTKSMISGLVYRMGLKKRVVDV